MAAKGHHVHPQNDRKKFSLLPLLSLLIFASIFLVLSLSNKTSISPSSPQTLQLGRRSEPDPTYSSSRFGLCNYSEGKWIYDPKFRFNQRYDSSCKEIFRGWNCLLNNKSNAKEIATWRWKPRGCDLQPLDPLQFLQTYRDTNIGNYQSTLG